MAGILEALGISPHDIDLLRDRSIPLDQPMPFDPSNQVPGSEPAVRIGDIAGMAMQSAPGVGDAYSALQAIKDLEEERYASSILNGIGALPMVAGMGAIKAYHGSPHKFDAFDMSKIGTGEGAQAYGHGLYFAGNQGIARYYQKALSNEYAPTVDDSVLANVKKLAKDGNEDAKYIVDGYQNVRKSEKSYSFQDAVNDFFGDGYEGPGGYAGLNDVMMQSGAREPSKGHFYETSLEWPDPAREAADPLGQQHFLDWDKSLSEQSRAVQDAWVSLSQEMGIPPEFSSLIGPTAVRAMLENDLKRRGVPGIRYLDQGSRGAGEGTYNYVVFDDQIPKIVSRDSEPVGVLEALE